MEPNILRFRATYKKALNIVTDRGIVKPAAWVAFPEICIPRLELGCEGGSPVSGMARLRFIGPVLAVGVIMIVTAVISSLIVRVNARVSEEYSL